MMELLMSSLNDMYGVIGFDVEQLIIKKESGIMYFMKCKYRNK